MGVDRSDDWMRQASRDLLKARADHDGGFHEWACFSAHQAAEKALKAAFQHLHLTAWGHSLTQLIRAMPPGVVVPEAVRAAAQQLDQYYIPTRYPDAFPAGAPQDYYTEQQSEEATRHAESVIQFCQGLLDRP